MENKIKKRVRLFYLLKNNIAIIFSWLIVIIVTLFFQNKISLFIANNSLVTYTEVKSDYFDLAYLSLAILIFIRYIWFLIKNYRLSKKQNYIIFSIVVVYLFLRNNKSDSLHFSYYNFEFLYYADLIIFIAFMTVILLIRNAFYSNFKLYDIIDKWYNNLKLDTQRSDVSFLIQDLPLEETNPNDNEIVIDEIVTAVQNLKPSNSFIIGINSIWGLGKTSFLKRLEYKLKIQSQDEPNPITFWFNAWQHQDEKSIINNFFNQLKKELSVFSGDSKSSIDSYLKEMMAFVDNKYLNFLKSITENIFADSETIKDYYDDINNIIESIDRKIIVFVDDIDRLNKTEILETLRILRNIADFKNVVFICGYDREYVVKQSEIDNYYLDKIFNLEINLTVQNQKNFVVYLNELILNSTGYTEVDKLSLITTIRKVFYDSDDESNVSLEAFFGEPINQRTISGEETIQIPLVPSFFFESRRDVKKFFNELFINVKTLKNFKDIELEDYLLLKLLFFKYKWMYKNFSAKKMSFWLGGDLILKFEQLKLDELLTNPKIENQEKIIIYSILNNLFPHTGKYNNSNRINQKRYFPIYFNNNVFNESFSFTQLITALEKCEIEKFITENVLEKENENLIKNDIKHFVLKYENIRNIEEYKQVINLIKKEYFGHVDEVEILDFIYLGETVFKDQYKELIDSIFTNFQDSFGLFMYHLSVYYSNIPNDISSRPNDFGNDINSKKIKEFNLLKKDFLLKISLSIVEKEIEENKNDLTKVLAFSNFFNEYYFTFFHFRIFFNEFKSIIIKYIADKFEDLFLDLEPRKTLLNIDYPFIANIFEDIDERNKIIEQANHLIENRNQWTNSDLNKRDYVNKGWDNFIVFADGMRESISADNLMKYNNLMDWLYTNQSIGYFMIPSDQDVDKFKKDREEGLNESELGLRK